MILVRICAALTSAYIFSQYVPNPATVLWIRLNCTNDWSVYCEIYSSRYFEISIAFKLITFFGWLAAWFYFEMKHRNRVGRTSKVLTHLRYGPIATMLIAIAAIIISDALLIQSSRWEIVHYIHSNAPIAERPSFKLHNNYRHWCGNGMAAAEYELYGDVPAAYFDSSDPAVRARVLHASMYVYDWINDPREGPAMVVLEKALKDPEPLVENLALEYRGELVGDVVIAQTRCINR